MYLEFLSYDMAVDRYKESIIDIGNQASMEILGEQFNYKKLLKQDVNVVLQFDIHGTLTSYVMYRIGEVMSQTKPVIDLMSVYVLPEHRGIGCFKGLVEAIQYLMTCNNIEESLISIPKESLRTFKGLGFEVQEYNMVLRNG